MLALWSYPVIAAAAVALLLPLAVRLAHSRGFVDLPGGRKRHEGEVPPVGGLIIFPVFAAIALWHGIEPRQGWLLGALALLLLLGALDDRVNVPAWAKFTVQWIASLIIVIPGGAVAYSMGNLLGFGPFGWGPGAQVFSAIAAVLLINAINLMDGLDGLAGGVGFIVLFWFLVCAHWTGNTATIPLPLILMGALAGFLAHNMRYPGHPRATVFMGDAGSLALGLSLAWFAMHFSQYPDLVIKPVSVAWLLALPIYDTCGQFARRISQGRHPFDADQHHFHHHFIFAGLTPGRATAAILALCFVTGMIGVYGIRLGLPEYVLGYLWVALLLGHIYMSMRPHRYRRVLAALRGIKADNDNAGSA